MEIIKHKIKLLLYIRNNQKLKTNLILTGQILIIKRMGYSAIQQIIKTHELMGMAFLDQAVIHLITIILKIFLIIQI